MKSTPVLILMLASLSLAGCADMTSTQQRTLSGAAIGAGAGAAGTAITGGCVWCGTVLGAGVGAASGWIYDQARKGRF
ncbi:MAG: hypothetical protein PHW76_05550 [Alphaproteobacteria bacterium]|nr:hypothetical protein [Alphaproteobacteria bacterium]